MGKCLLCGHTDRCVGRELGQLQGAPQLPSQRLPLEAHYKSPCVLMKQGFEPANLIGRTGVGKGRATPCAAATNVRSRTTPQQPLGTWALIPTAGAASWHHSYAKWKC